MGGTSSWTDVYKRIYLRAFLLFCVPWNNLHRCRAPALFLMSLLALLGYMTIISVQVSYHQLCFSEVSCLHLRVIMNGTRYYKAEFSLFYYYHDLCQFKTLFALSRPRGVRLLLLTALDTVLLIISSSVFIFIRSAFF